MTSIDGLTRRLDRLEEQAQGLDHGGLDFGEVLANFPPEEQAAFWTFVETIHGRDEKARREWSGLEIVGPVGQRYHVFPEALTDGELDELERWALAIKAKEEQREGDETGRRL